MQIDTTPQPAAHAPAWSERWPALARAQGVALSEPVVLALSGGADSVLLLHWLHAARETPITAVHVHHGLRGREADDEADFCRELCRSLDVPFRLRRADLSAAEGSLEAQARNARYGLLLEEAQALRVRLLVTAHHSDDALEGVLMRWVRGTELPGLVGPAPDGQWRSRGGWRVRVLRPLLGLRRHEIRELLSGAQLSWREDSSNADPRFTRNRVRAQLLPRIEALAGAEGVEHLRRFAQAVEQLESDLSARTAHLAWSELPAVSATRRREDRTLGGTLSRARLHALPRALRRRALWRLLLEATQEAPSRAQLDELVSALDERDSSRHGLRGGWIVRLNRTHFELHPPLEKLFDGPRDASRQLSLGFGDGERSPRPSAWVASLAAPREGFVLPTPGAVTLPDGRRISATLVPHDPQRAIPRTPSVVELDARDLPPRLSVRWPASGERFQPLGCVGTRPLRRFLADAGVPARERRLVPLVFAHDELLWVAGLRPAHPRRVQDSTRMRLRLELHSGSPWRAGRDDSANRHAPSSRARQLELY